MLRILVYALTLTLTGCLFTVDSSKKSGISQWAPAELERMEIGRTDSQWVRSTFGAPRRMSSYGNGTEIWRYQNLNETQSKVGLFLLFNVKVEKEHVETLAIELSNGIVTDYWVEKSS